MKRGLFRRHAPCTQLEAKRWSTLIGYSASRSVGNRRAALAVAQATAAAAARNFFRSAVHRVQFGVPGHRAGRGHGETADDLQPGCDGDVEHHARKAHLAAVSDSAALFDFLQWCVHNALHRIPLLWRLHKVHHSVVDMDWIGDWRFHWGEIVVYRVALYVPSAVFGFDPQVLFFNGILNTIVGHYAHANVRLSIGPLKYVLNSPQMHIWHHTHPDAGPVDKNFGITLSVWDWIFGTATCPIMRRSGWDLRGSRSIPRIFWGSGWLRFAARGSYTFCTRRRVKISGWTWPVSRRFQSSLTWMTLPLM